MIDKSLIFCSVSFSIPRYVLGSLYSDRSNDFKQLLLYETGVLQQEVLQLYKNKKCLLTIKNIKLVLFDIYCRRTIQHQADDDEAVGTQAFGCCTWH